MPEPVWPTSAEIHAAAAERLRALLDSIGGPISEIARATFSARTGLLSEQPHSLTLILAVGACVSAGADWRAALWPSVGAECMMAAADLFDDAADADPAGMATLASPGVLLTAGAGLLGLAHVAVTRAREEGADDATAVALVEILGSGFAVAANGQTANLEPSSDQVDALTAYRQAAAKSGPLGALIARLGARTATSSTEIIDLLGEFGQRLAVRSQLLNDARDAAPDAAVHKADVRAGARTVPLAFTGSVGAPSGLSEAQTVDWEQTERARISAGGGLAAAYALAEAERLGAVASLDSLAALGHAVNGLRALL